MPGFGVQVLQKSSHFRGSQGPSREGGPLIGQRDQRESPWPAELSSEALDPVRARGAEQQKGVLVTYLGWSQDLGGCT